jgi:hypothetical protein
MFAELEAAIHLTSLKCSPILAPTRELQLDPITLPAAAPLNHLHRLTFPGELTTHVLK